MAFDSLAPWLQECLSKHVIIATLTDGLQRDTEEHDTVCLDLYKSLRRIFLGVNRELIKGCIIRDGQRGPLFVDTCYKKALEMTKYIRTEREKRHRKRMKPIGGDGYADLVLTTLNKTVNLYRNQIKEWYGCSLNRVPLDVNHIIVSYLVTPK
tara:strand:+ start:941 stop:1399 length:459 start_codon:yes stop_codon:yes gene_type:complete